MEGGSDLWDLMNIDDAQLLGRSASIIKMHLFKSREVLIHGSSQIHISLHYVGTTAPSVDILTRCRHRLRYESRFSAQKNTREHITTDNRKELTQSHAAPL